MIQVGTFDIEIRTVNTGGLFLVVSDKSGRGFGTAVALDDLERLGKFMLKQSRARHPVATKTPVEIVANL